MATSRSADAARWLATASLFSGREDPEWQPPDDVVAELEDLFVELRVHEREPPEPPPLGYRGVMLIAPDSSRYEAYGGVVTLRTGTGEDRRLDPERRFENTLIGSAPPGAVPPEAVRG